MANIFADARQGKNLSPAARAFLKLLEGFIIAGIVAALPVLSLALGQQNVNWETVLRVALGTFATAALMGAVKYLKAQGDAPLAQEAAAGLTAVAAGVGQWAGLNDVGNKPAPGLAAPVLQVSNVGPLSASSATIVAPVPASAPATPTNY